MPCLTYQCNNLPEHTLDICGDNLKGGGNQVIIFACDATTTDYANDTTINADIAAGKAAIFTNIKVGWPAGTPTDAAASYVAGQDPKTVTYQFAGTWMDANVNSANDQAYADLNITSGFQAGAVLVKLVNETNTGYLVESTNGIQFKGTMVAPDSESDFLHYEYTLNHRHISGPVSQTLPSGIFS